MLFWTFDFERKKGSRIFLGHWSSKKNTNFQKILEKYHSGELLKQGTILHQSPQITLFFWLSLYLFCFIKIFFINFSLIHIILFALLLYSKHYTIYLNSYAFFMSPNFLFVNVTCLDTIFNFQKAIYFFGLGQTVIIVKQKLFQTVKETIYLGNNCKVKQIINQNLCVLNLEPSIVSRIQKCLNWI